MGVFIKMKKSYVYILALLLILSNTISGCGGGKVGSAGGGSNNRGSTGGKITINLTETSEAFKNPLKGFRPSKYFESDGFYDYEYASTFKFYIKYTDLESSTNDSVQKIKDWSNIAWAGIENKNIKVIPRVVIEYPDGLGGGLYWPNGVPYTGNTVSDWTNDTLKNRLVAMAFKLGEAWDNDPRVAAVELGLWGKWGEHHLLGTVIPGNSFGDRIPANFQQALGDAFTQAFKTKKLWFVIRKPLPGTILVTTGILLHCRTMRFAATARLEKTVGRVKCIAGK
jgi:hypothetical protein